MARLDRPESKSEYFEFERVRNGYERAGLCDTCAVQGSYGHQHGFCAVNPPCTLCSPIVATFEYSAPNAWRKASKERLRRLPVWASASSTSTMLDSPDAHISEAEAAA